MQNTLRAGHDLRRRRQGGRAHAGGDYNYFAWTTANSWGRLQKIMTGTPTELDSLQDLRYTYDALGNVLTIKDYKAGNPQTQTFTYDALNRLASAVASGGTGGTYASQSYTYHSTTGNLSAKAGVSYTYGDSSHKHAVTLRSDGSSFQYDNNGNPHAFPRNTLGIRKIRFAQGKYDPARDRGQHV